MFSTVYNLRCLEVAQSTNENIFQHLKYMKVQLEIIEVQNAFNGKFVSPKRK